MRTSIPNGLRTVFLINFIFAVIFGLSGTFAARLVGNIAGHPVRDVDVNMLMGLAALAFAIGSWFAYRATSWEQISIVTAMEGFFNLVGGIGGLVAYFVPSILGVDSLPPVQLVVAIVLTVLGIAFAYFYLQANRALQPALKSL